MSNDAALTLSAEQAEAILLERLCGRVRDLRVFLRAEGAVLRGVAANYYGKQMAQHLAAAGAAHALERAIVYGQRSRRL